MPPSGKPWESSDSEVESFISAGALVLCRRICLLLQEPGIDGRMIACKKGMTALFSVGRLAERRLRQLGAGALLDLPCQCGYGFELLDIQRFVGMR